VNKSTAVQVVFMELEWVLSFKLLDSFEGSSSSPENLNYTTIHLKTDLVRVLAQQSIQLMQGPQANLSFFLSYLKKKLKTCTDPYITEKFFKILTFTKATVYLPKPSVCSKCLAF